MNGRLYDPLLHRFLSPDEYVQDPTNTQNFNRYGYVLNNPLKYTDPSGNAFGLDDTFGIILGGFTNSFSNIASGNVTNVWTGFSYFFVGTIAGEIAVNTGGLGTSLSGAFLGTANNIIAQLSGHGHIDWGQAYLSGITGLVTADIGAELGNLVGPSITGLTDKIASPVLRQVATNAITTGGVGFTLGTAGGLISGKSFGASLGEGAKGGAQGLALGAITGGAEGFRFAQKYNLDLWTGRSNLTIDQAHSLGLQSITMGNNLQDIQFNPKQINADATNSDYATAVAKWNQIRARYGLPPQYNPGNTGFTVSLNDGGVIRRSFYSGGNTTPNGYSIKLNYVHPVGNNPKPFYLRYK
ncbi:hypothetical protein GCM10022392_32630 [Mucilaginibacter panaciglaebae]|uniref:RHS repeat-associated protein n=2 Tax=Mucilaginibacter panaciglaebae TaxID=502331 RepID=A0ABP7X4I2_9SPHI